jgi:hypothetical protein
MGDCIMGEILGAKIVGVSFNDRNQVIEVTLDNGKKLYPCYDYATDDNSIEIAEMPTPSVAEREQ